MKKQIVLATIATLATGSAYATKARMDALGQANDRGSFYINDTRNVFRNAARINQTNNYVVTEWGRATTGSTTADAVNDPNAEGGFFKNQGSFSYGVYLGSELTNQNRKGSTTGYANGMGGGATGTHGDGGFQERSNDLDLFFGGDMGVEWGARLHYANAKTEQASPNPELKASTLELGLGMVMGDLNAYVNYVINDELENSTTGAGYKWENDGTMNLGVGYNWMDYTFFADYNKVGGEFTGGTGVAVDTTEMSVLTVGAGYTKEISSTSRLFTDLSFVKTSAEDVDGANTANKVEVDRSELPLTVGFETDATSWLTLRGSISQNIFINSQKVKNGAAAELSSTRNNTTSVNAGATLNFGKLMIDGMIGTNGTDGGAAGSGTNRGVLDTDRLLTRVAVHYWF